ncbi:MAG: TerD family protein [Methylobacter sp.]|nr:TerD family protein [Methylobacter sp.]
MQDITLSLYSEKSRGRGWVGILITGLETSFGTTRACFKRWGHKKPFLGASGWQVAEDWVNVERGIANVGSINLIFSPEVTNYLEEGSNYILSLEVEGKRIFEKPIRWGGIASSYSRNETVNEEEAAWKIAEKFDSKAGYKAYLDRFPSGNYSKPAGEAFRKFMPPNLIVRVASNIADAKPNCSVDTSVFLLSADRKVRGDRDFVSSFASEGDSGQSLSKTPCGSVRHLGREDHSKNGYSPEAIAIDFHSLPSSVNSLAITVSIYTPPTIGGGLETVDNGTVEILQEGSKASIDHIPMQKNLKGMKGSFLIEFVRCKDDWILLKRNEVFAAGLQEICKYFGLELC